MIDAQGRNSLSVVAVCNSVTDLGCLNPGGASVSAQGELETLTPAEFETLEAMAGRLTRNPTGTGARLAHG